MIDIVEALAGSPTTASSPSIAPERPGEVQHIALDASRARDELGWEAKVGIDEGLEQTLASLR